MKKLTALALAVACTGFVASTYAQVYPTSFASYVRGPRKDGSEVPLARRNADNCLGAPQNDDSPGAPVNYASLGFGGTITLIFTNPIGHNPDGPDLTLVETTFGGGNCPAYPERVQVEVSQLGFPDTWLNLGEICQNSDLEIPLMLGNIRFVRLTDVSDINSSAFPGDADGYDVDGIIGYVEEPLDVQPCVQAPNVGVAKTFFASLGVQKNGNPLPASRSDANKALGVPQMSDVAGPINFVSLGFPTPDQPFLIPGIDLELNYSIFNTDNPAGDIAIFETTWGDGPGKSDASYPEIADVYGSDDGENYYPLIAIGEDPTLFEGQVTRDGRLDISSIPSGVLRYIIVSDWSTRSSSRFPGSADGYDLDGVIGTACLPAGSSRRLAINDNVEIGEMTADFNVSVAPNPVSRSKGMTINFETYEGGSRSVDLFDVTGKLVEHITDLNVEPGLTSYTWNSASAKPGLYMVRIAGQDAANTRSIRVLVID